MKKFFKRFLLLLLLVFIGIQFFRPAKNKSEGISANDITAKYAVPDDVKAILKTSCYDCHSNNTNYPWYSNIQPVAWWLKDHIDEGKRELNFSEFASYRIGRQYRPGSHSVRMNKPVCTRTKLELLTPEGWQADSSLI